MFIIDLKTDWFVRSEDLWCGVEMAPKVIREVEGWLCTDLPCDIHMPLIENGIIKEPLEGTNSLECQWTEQKSWWFKKIFNLNKENLDYDVLELTLESLDAEGDVFFNGFYLGHHKSAFYPFKYNIKDIIINGENTLLVRVSSGLEYNSDYDISKTKPFVSREVIYNRGDVRRNFVRKPQYVYGWDWGPRVPTCGIMKGAYINGFKEADIRFVHVVTDSLDPNVKLSFEVEVENFYPYSTLEASICLELEYEGINVYESEKQVLLSSGINYINFNEVIENPKLWWPSGMGKQNLYTIKVKLTTENIESAYKPFKYGIRTIKLNMDKISTSERLFAFEINGIKSFCKGANWIPADSIYARISDEKYCYLIDEAKEANFNMLRVWGGGIYEKDIFYEKCDEKGIMIWQDFMFACSVYPDNLDWFCREVINEVEYQTKRLRNHSSIVLWCGNNENMQGFDEWWIKEDKLSFWGGAKCYNQIIPEIVHKNCPEIPYWNGSPYGGKKPNSNEIGDRHHWGDCTMNANMEKRITPEEYDKVTSKFISEYGYIGPCRKASIQKYFQNAAIDKNSEIWNMHNNTFEKETVPAGIAKHYKDPSKLNLEEYLLYAGLCQGMMLNYSLEAFLFNPNCSGSLFWMYSDCWGEVGWTIIDYYLNRKPSYYFVKRAFMPVKLILRETKGIINVMGINATDKAEEVNLDYGYISFDGNIKNSKNITVVLKPFSREIIFDFSMEQNDLYSGCYYVKPIIENGKVLTETLRSNIFKELKIPKPQLSINNFNVIDNNAEFTITSTTFAHAVHFNLGDEILLSDEYFDLLPGESRTIKVLNFSEGFSEKCINAQFVI